jgi:hypothetical protein
MTSAWKLRAVVYGMLAVVAALVLWQSGALADEPDVPPRPHRTLTVYGGETSGGVPLTLSFKGTRLHSVSLRALGRSCDGRQLFGWAPAVGAPGVRFTEYANGVFRLEQRRRVATWTIEGFLQAQRLGDRVEGSLWYGAMTLGRSCHSDPVTFSARPTLP